MRLQGQLATRATTERARELQARRPAGREVERRAVRDGLDLTKHSLDLLSWDWLLQLLVQLKASHRAGRHVQRGVQRWTTRTQLRDRVQTPCSRMSTLACLQPDAPHAHQLLARDLLGQRA